MWAIRFLPFLGRALSYGTSGWALSDIFNEWQKTKQQPVDPNKPTPEPWSLAGSVLGQNWKKYLIGTLILAGAFWIGSLLINRKKK